MGWDAGTVLGGLGTDPFVVVVCGLAVAVGALVQGVLGFGLAMLAVPVLAWLAPQTVPVGILVAVMPLVVAAALRERAHLDVRGIGWALLGRLPGGVAGAVAVALLPVRGLQLLVAATVALAVVAAVVADARSRASARPAGPRAPGPGPGAPGAEPPARGAEPPVPGAEPPVPGAVVRIRRTTLVGAGVLSGVGGTTSGIGGPPMAIAFRNSGGPVIRSSLAVFFALGALLSIASLALVGEVTAARLGAGLVLLPFVGLGYVASGLLRDRVRPRALRVAVLALSGVSAVGLFAEALSGLSW